jgi:hypothetical protein
MCTGVRVLSVACIFFGIVSAQTSDTGLVAYWPFDTLVGGTAADASGHGFNATCSGVGLVAGRKGNALECTGSTFTVDVPNSVDSFSVPRFTVEAWLYSYVALGIPGSAASYTHVFDVYTVDATTSQGYALQITDYGKLEFVLARTDGNGHWIVVASATTLASQTWYHLVGTYDGAALRIYINGQPEGTVPYAGGYELPHNNATIAYLKRATGETMNRLNGKIDEVRLYRYALSPQEVMARYQDTLSSPLQPKLIAYAPDPTTDNTPTLTWHSLSGATNYKVLADTSLSFAHPQVSAYSAGDTSYTPAGPLPWGTIYWKASSNLDYSVYSAVDVFQIVDPSLAPVLTPYPYDSTTDRYPVLSWAAVPGATHYLAQASTSPTFSSVLWSDTVTATRCIPPSALPFGPVYWRVSSDRAYALFSAADTFTVIPLPAPVILGPPDMSNVSPSDSVLWTASRDPSAPVWYEVLVSTADDFSSGIVANPDSLVSTRARIGALDDSLPLQTMLFWKVRAHNGWGLVSTYSATRAFRLSPTALHARLSGQTAGQAWARVTDGGHAIAVGFPARDLNGAVALIFDTRGRLVQRLVPTRDGTGQLTARCGIGSGRYIVCLKTSSRTVDVPVVLMP